MTKETKPANPKETARAHAARPTANDCCIILESVASRVIARAIYAAGVAALPNGLKAVSDAMETTAYTYIDEVHAMAYLGKRMSGDDTLSEAERVLDGINDALRELWEDSEYDSGPLMRTSLLEAMADDVAACDEEEDAGGDDPAAE